MKTRNLNFSSLFRIIRTELATRRLNGDGLDCSLAAVSHLSPHLLRSGELGDPGALSWSQERRQIEN